MVDKGIGIIIAIVGLASLAVIVSKKSATASVITALLTGISKLIASATAPVTSA